MGSRSVKQSVNVRHQTTFEPPVFQYSGGKGKIRDWLIKYFPRRVNTYCEPFVGLGNVYWRAAVTITAQSWWLNDIKRAPFFEALKVVSIRDLPDRVKDDRDKEWRRRLESNDPVALVIAPQVTWAGSMAGKWWSDRVDNPSVLRGEVPPTYVKRRVAASILAAKEILALTNPRITSLDYREVLSRLKKGDFAYIDPPYYQADVPGYKNDTLDHREMIDLLLKAQYWWVLSEYDQPMYREAFGPPCSTQRLTKGSSGTKEKRPVGLECLWWKGNTELSTGFHSLKPSLTESTASSSYPVSTSTPKPSAGVSL